MGYDEDDTNAMYITQFMGVTENGLEEKYEGYVSISGGYVFILPENWENTTVVNLWEKFPFAGLTVKLMRLLPIFSVLELFRTETAQKAF